MSFNSISRVLLDNWLSLADPTPEQIFGSVIDRVSIRWRIAIIRTEAQDPRDWVLEPVKQMGMVSRLLDLNAVFKGGRLGDIGDRAYIDQAVIPQYRSVVQSRQPAIDHVRTKLLGMKVLYDRILLPEKSGGDPSWLVTACFGRFLSPMPEKAPVIDDIDQVIFLNLSKGHSAKEIAGILNLSHRTIEHRIDRMKRQTGAKNTTNLVALMTTAGFEGAIRYRAE